MIALEAQLNAEAAGASARRRQEWFVGIGLLLLVLGAFAGADLFASDVATAFFVGVLMSAAAALGLAHAYHQKDTTDFGLWMGAGIAYAIVAALTLANPTLSAWMPAALLGAALTFSGMAHLILSFRLRANDGWVWLALSGAISGLTGLTFLLGSTGDAVWMFGAILSFDLAFRGCALIALGLAIAI